MKKIAYKKHRGRHTYKVAIEGKSVGYTCTKCGKRVTIQAAWDYCNKTPYLGFIEEASHGMKRRVDEYLDKILAPENTLTGSFEVVGTACPKVGDTVTMGNIPFRVTKILNKRKSREYEVIMKKIRELQ